MPKTTLAWYSLYASMSCCWNFLTSPPSGTKMPHASGSKVHVSPRGANPHCAVRPLERLRGGPYGLPDRDAPGSPTELPAHFGHYICGCGGPSLGFVALTTVITESQRSSKG